MTSIARIAGDSAARLGSAGEILGSMPLRYRVFTGLAAMLAGYFVVKWIVVAGRLIHGDFIELIYLGVAGPALLFLHYREAGTTWGKSHKLVALMGLLATGYIALWLETSIVVEGLSLLFLVPLAEELFFRGMLFPALRSQFGALLAILLTTALFVAMHAGMAADGLLQMALLSVICCVLMLVRGGLLLAVVAHSWWNHIALGGDYLANFPMGMAAFGPGLIGMALLIMLLSGGGNARDLRL
ncbi:MAG TPA: CPBP family intramembrane metalloprotease [Firmicutes bacterium]|nr:CPBP family intramembrane metalloprotease [Bacillota bacterium]